MSEKGAVSACFIRAMLRCSLIVIQDDDGQAALQEARRAPSDRVALSRARGRAAATDKHESRGVGVLSGLHASVVVLSYFLVRYCVHRLQ